MGETRTIGDVDLLTADIVKGLAAIDGPCASVFMPTHRHGPETQQGPIRLRNLLDRAVDGLRALDVAGPPADELLAPLWALVDDVPFWQHQGDGLRQLQVRSVGGGGQFHGHGAGDEVDKAALERYLRAVDRGLAERLGPVEEPLVLASVGYYVPIFKAVSRHPRISDAAVDGNPERRSAPELHAGAWPLVEEHFSARAERLVEQYRQAAGTGRTATGPDEVASAAGEGRVDTLFVGEGPAVGDDPVDRALLDTLRHGGQVVGAHGVLEQGAGVAALLRF